ncbi:MAG: RsmD family RNA methyltransferase [Planctomycetaceae bacterium]
MAKHAARRSKEPPPPDPTAPPRIIGGSLRGRKLAFVPDPRTRPMKDRVRETLFDLLGPTVIGTTVIDMFAGTGALGFEAVSRGATRAVLVERHFPTADALKRSAKELDITDRIDVRPGDALNWAKRMPDLPIDRPWAVFISPPWGMFTDRRAEILALITALMQAAPAGSTFVVEADESLPAAELPDSEAWETRPVHPAVLHIHSGLVS